MVTMRVRVMNINRTRHLCVQLYEPFSMLISWRFISSCQDYLPDPFITKHLFSTLYVLTVHEDWGHTQSGNRGIVVFESSGLSTFPWSELIVQGFPIITTISMIDIVGTFANNLLVFLLKREYVAWREVTSVLPQCTWLSWICQFLLKHFALSVNLMYEFDSLSTWSDLDPNRLSL